MNHSNRPNLPKAFHFMTIGQLDAPTMASADRVEMQLSIKDKRGDLQVRIIKSLGERTKATAGRGPGIVVSLHPDRLLDRKPDGSMPELVFRVPQSTKVRVWNKKPAREPRVAIQPEEMFEPLSQDAVEILAGKPEAQVAQEVATGQDNRDPYENNDDDSAPFVPPTIVSLPAKVG